MPPLDVLIVEPTPSGGLFHYAVQLGAALARRGHRVRLLTGPDPELRVEVEHFEILGLLPTWHPGAAGEESPLWVRLRRVWRGIRWHLAWILVLRRIRADEPDVVFWSTYRFPVDGFCAAFAARRVDAPITAMVVHEPRPLATRRRGGRLYQRGSLVAEGARRLYQSLDIAYVLGPRAEEVLRAAHPGLGRVEVIPHGDQDALLPSDGRVPVPAGDTGPELLFFGAWTRYKGLPLLLEAFAEVRRAVPDARLVVAGAPGADVDVAALRRAASSIGGVDLRPGYVPLEAVPGLFATARAVVVPYLRASQSGVAALAQTFGRPVVATDVGDLADLVADGVSGLVVTPGSVHALADALIALLVDAGLADRLGTEGRARAGDRGSWDAVAAQVEVGLRSVRGLSAPGAM